MSPRLLVTVLLGVFGLVAGACTDEPQITETNGSPAFGIGNAPATSGPVNRFTADFIESFVFEDTPDGETWILWVGLPEDVGQLIACGGQGITEDLLSIQEVVREGRTNLIGQRLQARAVAYNLAEFDAEEGANGICSALELEPVAVGTVNFVFQDNDVRVQTSNNVFGFSLIGRIGTYSVHLSARFRIIPHPPEGPEGDEFIVLHEDAYIR